MKRSQCALLVLLFMIGSTLPAQAVTSQTLEAAVALGSAPVSLHCPVAFPQVCLIPSPGNVAVANVSFDMTFASLEELCFVLHFTGDLVDPGERIGINLDPSLFGGFGFQNIGDAPIDQREICLAAGFHDELLAFLLDGQQTIRIFVESGSATLVDVQVFATGVVTSAELKPGKGCGDKNHVHERRGECKIA